MTILAILVGGALLLFGRQLFWLFVGGAGFAAGMALAADLFQGQQDWVVLTVAILAGLIGALLAVFLQRLAVGAAGFLAGGYVLLNVSSKLGHQDWIWPAFLVGGILGAMLVIALFDWALIVLSAITGALLVSDSLRLQPSMALLVFATLLSFGVVAQGAQLRRHVPAPPEPVKPT